MNNLRKGRFILTPGIRVFSPWLAVSISFRTVGNAEASWQKDHVAHLMAGSKESEIGVRDKVYPSKACPQGPISAN
jgi:hypothetical protein